MKEIETEHPLESENEINRLKKELQDYLDEATIHLKYDHHGYPATSCHYCLTLQQIIILTKEEIAILEYRKNKKSP